MENNFKQNNILKLKQIFPEVFCEDQIDFEKLKLVLGAENLAGAGERYQLDWAGKTAAYLNLQSPTSRTLVPCKEESADFDGTQNVFIEAENLEALKILQKAYAGSVKMIYIDPPYNTGSDSFIYPDKFSESREEYARRVGDTDDAGYLKRDGVFQGAWRKNGKDSGHYHSNWLSMMLPRLHLAKTLLREDGVIFISIDDNEQAQLKLLCDEVFGAENFVAELPWKGRGGGADDKNLLQNHEYILMYARNKEQFTVGRKIKSDEKFPKFDAEKNRFYKTQLARKWGSGATRQDRPNLFYPIKTYDGIEITPKLPDGSDGRWRWNEKRMKTCLSNKDIEFQKRDDGEWEAYEKVYQPLEGEFRTQLYAAWLQSEIAEELEEILDETDGKNTAFGTKQTKLLFDNQAYFSYPKPTPLIKILMKIASLNNNEIIMDFFSGSGTTAHAVMQLNAEDGGSRRFICVQLPEETDEKSEARKAGFDTIAEIAKERIRRAGRQISDGLQDGSEIDTGFKVFKLAESGFKQWRQPGQADTEALQRELYLNIDSVLSETSSENLLYELMLRMGLKLTCKVSFSDDVYFVEDEDTGGLYAFLLERVDQGLIDAVLSKHPAKVATLDRLFEGDDALKSNTVLQMKDAGVMFECV
ncbi:site-specific DNA-methyltransferase [Neisseria sp. P0022.S007]|uniref:site-specific DNA-methyltransferase n=1 Tax=unclassified Neisseria TaxID=2623750 RepID=UPI003F816EF2